MSAPDNPTEVLCDENEDPNMDSACGARKKTSHPKAVKEGAAENVYKKLSVINGEINKMSREMLQERLTDLKMDARGVNDVLRKRLKSYYRQRKLMRANVHIPSTKPAYDYLLVIDFEATCEADTLNYPHEIIEFPIILIDVHQMKVVDEFHSFCKPIINPKLSEFCTELTGITQADVDASEEFPLVFKKVERWMAERHLGDGNKFAVVTDGPWDISRFLSLQCQHSNHIFPRWAKKWINVRKLYATFYQCRQKKLENMLIYLGMKFEGNQHSGLDDSRNIARIVTKLLKDGCTLKVNNFIYDYPDFHLLKFFDSSDSDGEGTDAKSDSAERSSKQNGASNVTDVTKVMKDVCLEDTKEENKDDVDDLLQYYKLQKS